MPYAVGYMLFDFLTYQCSKFQSFQITKFILSYFVEQAFFPPSADMHSSFFMFHFFSSIDIRQYKIHTPQNRHQIRYRISFADFRYKLHVRKRRRPDSRPVRMSTVVGDQIIYVVSLGGFHSAKNFPGWNSRTPGSMQDRKST